MEIFLIQGASYKDLIKIIDRAIPEKPDRPVVLGSIDTFDIEYFNSETAESYKGARALMIFAGYRRNGQLGEQND